jgi:hypothetical protein
MRRVNRTNRVVSFGRRRARWKNLSRRYNGSPCLRSFPDEYRYPPAPLSRSRSAGGRGAVSDQLSAVGANAIGHTGDRASGCAEDGAPGPFRRGVSSTCPHPDGYSQLRHEERRRSIFLSSTPPSGVAENRVRYWISFRLWGPMRLATPATGRADARKTAPPARSGEGPQAPALIPTGIRNCAMKRDVVRSLPH